MTGAAKPGAEPGPPTVNQTFNGNRFSSSLPTLSVYAKIDTELMRAYLARGEMEAARSAFQQAEEVMAKISSPHRREVYVIVERVRSWLASGALDRAIHWEQELAQQDSMTSPLARKRQDCATSSRN